jgi:hypothetical protein
VTPLAAYPRHVNRLYGADLFGAALGCTLAVAGLTWLDAPGALAVCAAVFLVAGALYAGASGLRAALMASGVVLLAAAPFAHRVVEFVPTDTKALGRALKNPRTKVLLTRWSPVNRVDLYRVSGWRGGFWDGVGRSPHYHGPGPRVLAIQYDGHNGSDIYEVTGDGSLGMLDHNILATPYVFGDRRDVLVIGVGGGIDVVNALHHGTSHVTGVELQPITVELLKGRLNRWTGGWFRRPEVELVAGEGRHYVRSHNDRYDLIQITAVDTFSAQSTGAYVLAESYLYTVEAFSDYLSRLTDEGVISIVLGDPLYRDASLPPPLGTRLALIARTALERRGVASSGEHIVAIGRPRTARSARPENPIRGALTQNLIVKSTPFAASELEAIRTFATDQGFTLLYTPDASGDTAFERLIRAAPDELDRYLGEARFALRPVSDDRPFFYHVLRWRSLLTGEGIVWYFPGSATGQAVLLMMLGQALLLGGTMIMLPLVRRGTGKLAPRITLAFLAYFLALGLGFLLVEISFVQKYVLILGYPTYSLSVTIFSLLVFAAAGAVLSRRGWRNPRAFLAVLLAVTLALISLEVVALPWVREFALRLSLPARILVTVLLQLPIGLALGMYFPTGLEMLRRIEPDLIPWAWAVNGVASVTSAVLAVILGMALGFTGVAWTAAGIYALGTLTLLVALRGAAVG